MTRTTARTAVSTKVASRKIWRAGAGAALLLAGVDCARKQWPDPPPASPPPAERDVEEHTARPIQTDFPFQSSALGTRSPVGQIVDKSIAIRLAPDVAVSFDTDLLRMGAGWTGEFIQATGVTFDTTHGTHPWAGGYPHFVTAPVPGWGDARGRFADPRRTPYGPIPDSLGRWDGLYVAGNDVVLSYTVQGAKIHEQPSAVRNEDRVGFVRTFEVAGRERPLWLLVADVPGARKAAPARPAPDGSKAGTLTLSVAGERAPEAPPAARREGAPQPAAAGGAPVREITEVAVVGAPPGTLLLQQDGGRIVVQLPRGAEEARFKLVVTRAPEGSASALDALVAASGPPKLIDYRAGGPRHWPQSIVTQGRRADGPGPYLVDRITTPYPGVYEGSPKGGDWKDNIFKRRIMIAGFDFFPGGKRAALSTWEGDVWIVDGIDGDLDRLTWHRFASGLFEPLGLAIVDGVVHASGRDQITRLHDLNGDGEADHYENFNNQSTNSQGFHEFQFDLQTDAKGNFYTAKAAPVRAGGRGFGGGGGNGEVTPFAGTVHRISPDGKRREVYATGLRAPNGIGVSPAGQVTTGDNEGTWIPASPLNWVRPGSYHGVEDSAHRKPIPKPDPPLCWISKAYDNSGGSQVWVTSDRWGPFKDELLHLSYGRASVYLVLRQQVDGLMQGGIVRLVGGPDAAQITGSPARLTSSAMRARFNPDDGQLYVAGLSGWQSDAVALTGFDRIRYTGKAVHTVRGLAATTAGVELTFSHPLDPRSVDAQSFSVQRWNYVRSSEYGSPEFSVENPGRRGHDRVEVLQVALSEDGKSVLLDLDDLRPAHQVLIEMRVKATDGTPIRQTVMHTIHKLARDPRAGQGARVASAQRPRGAEGLLLRVTTPGKSGGHSEVAPMVKLHVPAGTPASPFLPRGGFTATWQGTLWPEMRATHLLMAEVDGDLRVSLDDQVVLVSDGKTPAQTVRSRPLLLERKPNKIEVTLRGGTGPATGVRLHWARLPDAGGQAATSPRSEPIPASAFRHTAGPELASSLAMGAGRELFLAHRCASCHLPEAQRRGNPELAAMGPDFAAIGSRLDWRWIREWVLNPRAVRPSATMPALLAGPQAKADAEAIAAYLATLQDPRFAAARDEHAAAVKAAADRRESPQSTDQALAAAGEAGLVDKLRCGGCHVDQANAAEDGRLPLQPAGRKFLPGSLTAYLRDPTAHYAWNPMPHFRLSPAEAVELETTIRAWGGGRPPPAPPSSPELLARGRTLVETTGCLHCHQAPDGGPQNRAPVTALGRGGSGPRKESCVLGTGPARHDFSKEQVGQLERFLAGGVEAAVRHAPAEFAARQIRQLRCNGCHGAFEGIPELDRLGDKLRPEWMAAFMAGKVPYKPRGETHPDGQPWMPARMPGFIAQAPLLAAGMAAAAGHGARTEADGPLDPSLVAAGATLVSATGGFSCVACHGVGTKAPTQVFEAEGINLSYSAERLRPDFFRQWLRDPMRVDPSTRMPNYFDETGQSPLTGILRGQADAQIEAIWQYLRKLGEERAGAPSVSLGSGPL
jgi:mono/diheme cytochrome c family protein